MGRRAFAFVERRVWAQKGGERELMSVREASVVFFFPFIPIMAAPPPMPWSVPGTAPRPDEDGLDGSPGAGDDDAPAQNEAAALDAGGLYAALNLPRDADEEAVRRAYRGLAGACHPDKVAPELREAASEQFARLQRAYEVGTGDGERGREVSRWSMRAVFFSRGERKSLSCLP